MAKSVISAPAGQSLALITRPLLRGDGLKADFMPLCHGLEMGVDKNQIKLAAKRLIIGLSEGNAESIASLKALHWDGVGLPKHQQILELLARSEGYASYHSFCKSLAESTDINDRSAKTVMESDRIFKIIGAANDERIVSLELSDSGRVTINFSPSHFEDPLSNSLIPEAALRTLEYSDSVGHFEFSNWLQSPAKVGRKAFMFSPHAVHQLSDKLKDKIVDDALSEALARANISDVLSDLQENRGAANIQCDFSEEDARRALSLLEKSFKETLQYYLDEAELEVSGNLYLIDDGQSDS